MKKVFSVILIALGVLFFYGGLINIVSRISIGMPPDGTNLGAAAFSFILGAGFFWGGVKLWNRWRMVAGICSLLMTLSATGMILSSMLLNDGTLMALAVTGFVLFVLSASSGVLFIIADKRSRAQTTQAQPADMGSSPRTRQKSAHGPILMFVVGGVVLLAIIGLGFWLLKNGTQATSMPSANGIQATSIPTAIGGGTGRIAFSAEKDGNRDVYIMDADGSNAIRLTTNENWDWSPTWSPDGNQIAFLSFPEDGSNVEIYIMNADGSNARRLTNNQSFEGYPAWSPDGKSIAFASDREEPDPDGCVNSTTGCNNNIYVINLEDLTETRLTDSDSPEEGPAWSPDGKRIAFFSDHKGNGDIFVMNADGSEPMRLTRNPLFEWRPAWSPDGNYIAYMTLNDNWNAIYSMDSDGLNITRLTNNTADDSAPAWSPDGQHLAFQSSSSDGNTRICIVDFNGANQTCLTNNLTNAWEPKWQPLTTTTGILPTNQPAALTSIPVNPNIIENFNDDSNGWSTGNVDGNYWVGTRLVQNGVLDWDGISRKAMFSFVTPDNPAYQEYLTDVRVSSKVKLLNPTMKGYYGVAVRVISDNDLVSFYAFILDPGGKYAFWLYSNSEWKTLIDWSPINANLGEWNTMTVQAVGSHFRLSLNDDMLAETDDSSLASGVNGVIVGVNEADVKLQVQYDDFEVIVPSENTAGTLTPLPLTPPTATRTSDPALLPTEVIVLVRPEAMDVISSWNSSINAFTPANNPVTNLMGFSATDVGFWNNSRLGLDLFKEVVKLLSADIGSEWTEGVYGCPQVNEAFLSCNLRIYFTDNSITEIEGAARVIFQSSP